MKHTFSNAPLTRRHPLFATQDPTETLILSDLQAQGGLPDLAMFGVNFTGKCYEDWRWHNANGYLNILTKYHHPAYLNLTGAEQYNEARHAAASVRQRMPQTRILWRHMKHTPPGAAGNTDRGMWRLPAQEYVDNIVLAHGTQEYYNVTDCEGHIDRHEIKTYAAMEAQRLDYGVPKGARFAVLRMSTHHPLPDILDSGDLDEYLKAIGRNMGNWDDPKVVISNNGYFDDDNIDGLLTARRIEQRCIKLFGFRPIIVMGELNYDKGFTSVNGWRVSGMNGAQMVGKVIDHAQHIAGMAACVYGVGFSDEPVVKNFHLDNAELELLMKLSPVYAPPGPVVIPPPNTEEPPVIQPPGPEIALKPAYDAILTVSTNLRTEPTTDSRKSKVVGTVKVEPGKDTVVIVQEPVEEVRNTEDAEVYTWFRVTADLPLFSAPVTAWMAKHRADLFKRLESETPPVEPPVEPPEPEPPDEPNEVPATKDDVDKLRVEMMQYSSEKFEALLARIDTLTARVDVYERIMRAHQLSIENELKLAG